MFLKDFILKKAESNASLAVNNLKEYFMDFGYVNRYTFILEYLFSPHFPVDVFISIYTVSIKSYKTSFIFR